MNDSTDSNQLVEHFFRYEYANLVAVLVRAFSFARIDLVEDMVSSAIMQAMNSWKKNGVPENPAAWIHRVARNKILDSIRREKAHEKAIYLRDCAPGHIHTLAGNTSKAIDAYLAALSNSPADHQKALIESRLMALKS